MMEVAKESEVDHRGQVVGECEITEAAEESE